MLKVGDHIVLVGNSKEEQLNDFLVSSLNQFHTSTSIIPKTGMIFYRCIVGDVTYFSKCYTRTKNRNNFTVLYHRDGELFFCEIDFFLCVSINQTFHVYASVTELMKQDINRDHFNLPHSALDYGIPGIVPVSISEPKVLIDVSCILCKCVSVTIHPIVMFAFLPIPYYWIRLHFVLTCMIFFMK